MVSPLSALNSMTSTSGNAKVKVTARGLRSVSRIRHASQRQVERSRSSGSSVSWR